MRVGFHVVVLIIYFIIFDATFVFKMQCLVYNLFIVNVNFVIYNIVYMFKFCI